MARTKKSALTVQKPFPVLLLPPEIRNNIWRYAVLKEGDVDIEKTSRKRLASVLRASRLRSGRELRLHREDDQRRIASKLAVAFTCRQAYLEVTPIYYRENTFNISNGWRYSPNFNNVKTFAESIGSEKAASILSIRLVGSSGPLEGCLSQFSGLERLGFFDQQFGFRRPEWVSEVISYVQKHPSTIVTNNGKVWSLQEWIALGEKYGKVGN